MTIPDKIEISGRGTFIPDDETKQPASILIATKNRSYSIEWIPFWQGVETGVTLMEQAKYEKPLTQTEYRVRDMLLGLIHIGNWAIINQSEIARQLRIDQADVSKAIKRLIALGIVIKGEKMGKMYQYMIAPGFAFKGALPEGQELVKKAAKEHKAKVLQFKQKSLLDE